MRSADTSITKSEHLKRHERIHTADKQYECPECRKSFGRRDALQRHQQIHQTDAPSLLLKGARACTQCASAKVRCSGEPNCTRCQQRSLFCVYPGGNGNGASNASEADRSSQYDAMSIPAMPLDPAPVQITPTNAVATEPVANPAMMWTFDPGSLDADLWNPNILSTANWLDAVVDPGFPDFSWDMGFGDGQSSQFGPYDNLSQQPYIAPASGDPVQSLSAIKETQEQPSPAGLVSMASGQSGASTESAADAIASSEDTPTQEGQYYVDGQPARIPRTKRRKLSSLVTNRFMRTTTGRNFSFQNALPANADLSRRIAIPAETYEMFQAAYRATCSESGFWTPFEAANFLSRELLEHLLSLYFSSFYSKHYNHDKRTTAILVTR